jgi:hypothetical protein
MLNSKANVLLLKLCSLDPSALLAFAVNLPMSARTISVGTVDTVTSSSCSGTKAFVTKPVSATLTVSFGVGVWFGVAVGDFERVGFGVVDPEALGHGQADRSTR